MPPLAIVDPASIDTTKILYDIEGIRRGNPQRFEMERVVGIQRIGLCTCYRMSRSLP